jgi:hypothetical protein
MNATDFLSVVVTGYMPCFGALEGSVSVDDLFAAAEMHGVTALVYARLAATEHAGGWPPVLVARLQEATRSLAAHELLVKAELVRLSGCLARAGVGALMLKGAPLAYAVYDVPYLRQRGDTDILVDEGDRTRADAVLLETGYKPDVSYSHGVESYQSTYRCVGAGGLTHVVDLHWRLSNRKLFAPLFPMDELCSRALPVPGLGSAARMPSLQDGLLVACLHRVSHISTPYFVNGLRYCEANRLIWLYDIRLLCERMADEDWTEVCDRAEAKGLCAVCRDGLDAARGRVGARVPAEVMARLEGRGASEPSAAYLRPGLWRRRLAVELWALGGWPERLKLVADWALPPAEHMLKKYRTRKRWLLPLLYVRRAVGGLLKLAGPNERR